MGNLLQRDRLQWTGLLLRRNMKPRAPATLAITPDADLDESESTASEFESDESDADDSESDEETATKSGRTVEDDKHEHLRMMDREKEIDMEVDELSHRISCSAALKNILTPETVRMCNEIASELKEDDPGLVVQVTDFAAVHAALGLPSIPRGLQQGADEMGSYVQFRDWLIRSAERAPGVTSAQQTGGQLSTCWHHLSERQAIHIVYDEWKDNAWSLDLSRAGISVCLVLKVTGTGRGRCDMFVLPKVFS